MKTRKTFPKMPAINQSDATNPHSFKTFCLPVSASVVMSLGLGLVCNSVRAETTGANEAQRNYQYIKPQNVENTAGKTTQNQTTQGTSSAKNTGVDKASQGQQAAASGTGGTAASGSQAAKESTGAKSVAADETAKKSTGNTSAMANLNSKESMPEKCADTGNLTSGMQKSSPAGSQGSTGKSNQASTESFTTLAKEGSGQASASGGQSAKTNPINKVADAGAAEKPYPDFEVADKNGDHYITKDELKDYPTLLQVFDKVDAGKDGKLEQHEYVNLEMETKREGEIS